ncbi:hypothetical protein LAG90_01620 [Marinilongibacter aquaticus]|uniref:2-keto-4-pentenoate hydratase n=1 Tax=Marinilongibacter aquaticus TaxID=2975157 RepID=UPI0021BD07A6|nr:hypothetical protein [Marinilongibacter aquaticus]UBM59355.1 hypothetical protein LAG90_01620 [Marinilongibacter aquaticus]
MIKNAIALGLSVFLLSCGSNASKEETSTEMETEQVVDSLLYFRQNKMKTDFLARNFPDLGRQEAAELQLASLSRELAAGAELAGWKMGGTVGDSTKFDPIMGYMLKANGHQIGEKIPIGEFPEKEIMIEGEVGFVFKKDFPDGVKSMDELKEGIDYAVAAVEFAQSNAIGIDGDASTLQTNHVFAFDTGQAGYLLGDSPIPFADFDVENETVECFVNGELAASGQSSNIYKGHLNALYALANLLPKYGQQIRAGEVVITGSMYTNPTVTSASEIELKFKSLGEIHFDITD